MGKQNEKYLSPATSSNPPRSEFYESGTNPFVCDPKYDLIFILQGNFLIYRITEMQVSNTILLIQAHVEASP